MNTIRIYTTETETTSGVVSNMNDSVSKRQTVCAWIVWTYLCHCSLCVFSMCMDLSRGSGGCSSSRQEPHGIKTARMEGPEVGASHIRTLEPPSHQPLPLPIPANSPLNANLIRTHRGPLQVCGGQRPHRISQSCLPLSRADIPQPPPPLPHLIHNYSHQEGNDKGWIIPLEPSTSKQPWGGARAWVRKTIVSEHWTYPIINHTIPNTCYSTSQTF